MIIFLIFIGNCLSDWFGNYIYPLTRFLLWSISQFPPASATSFYWNVNNAISGMGLEFPDHCSYFLLVISRYRIPWPRDSILQGRSPTGDGLWLMTPGADGQCQAYHYHHQLPGTAEYTGTLWKQIISRKQVDQIFSDFIHILHQTLFYPCSLNLCDIVF